MAANSEVSFDWDDANVSHIRMHAVTPAEAQQVVMGGSLPLHIEQRAGEERHMELGETAHGRLLVIVWTRRGQKIRVVTAFPANRKWRAVWRRLRKGEMNV